MEKSNGRLNAIQGRENGEAQRLAYMLSNMASNKAYLHACTTAGGDPDGQLLESFRERFRAYRENWRAVPRRAVREKLVGERFAATQSPPLCVDIEVASVCDLACPFCYRQFVATPDKVMSDDLAIRLIDQAAELGVPSMKFNWRGEPLLHPRLPALIAHAKRRGILETIINTNATCLDEKTAASLIEAGLDLIIYSFDGGSEESYEKMRPGRFQENTFEAVYSNIKRFARIRAEKNASLPRTKIQMILTKETFPERDSFYRLFEDCVDDVSVKQYTERGGNISDLDVSTRVRLDKYLVDKDLSPDTPFFRDSTGRLFVSTGRLPCEQPYQRMLATYDGRVGMCCYDWGAQHPVGYVDSLAIEQGESEYARIVARAQKGDKGFVKLKLIEMPKQFNRPRPAVESLAEIWVGPEIDSVRRAHVEGRASDVEICRACPFKETYNWEEVED